MRTENRRRDGRFVAHFECNYAASRLKGVGTLTDISHFGAFIDEASELPSRGELVTLGFEDAAAASMFLYGWVTRHEARGFAIEFDELDEDSRRLVGDLAGLVGTGRSGR